MSTFCQRRHSVPTRLVPTNTCELCPEQLAATHNCQRSFLVFVRCRASRHETRVCGVLVVHRPVSVASVTSCVRGLECALSGLDVKEDLTANGGAG